MNNYFMKVIIVKRLIFIIVLISLSMSTSALASTDPDSYVQIDSVEVDCKGVKKCDYYIDRWKSLVGGYKDLYQLREIIKLTLFQINVTQFEYRLFKEEFAKTILHVSFYVPPVVNEIKLQSNIAVESAYFKSILILKEGSVFSTDLDLKNCEIIKNFFRERGYFNAKVVSKTKTWPEFNKLDLLYTVDEGPPILIKQFEVQVSNKKVKKRIISQLNELNGTPYDLLKVKFKIDEIEKMLIESGYLFSQIQEYNFNKQSENHGILNLKIELGERYVFTFLGNSIYNVQELRELVREQLKKGQKSFNSAQIKKTLNDMYEEIGIQNTEIKFELVKKKDLRDKEDDSIINNYIFKIKEGQKIVIEKMEITGNKQIESEKLINLFTKNASILVSRNFYDKRYIYDFKDMLRKYYIENGFMYASVDGPEVKFSEEKPTKVSIHYQVKEDNQTMIEEINVTGIPENLIEKSLEIITNKALTPLNTSVVDQDIKRVIEFLREEGYYYANIKENAPDKIIKFSLDLKRAKIFFNMDTGEKIFLSKVIVAGNDRTKEKVVKREINMREGDVITPTKLEKIKNDLQGLGVFSQINVTLVPGEVENNRVNILISVQEKESGYIELAPGYRTDLGVKFSAEVGHRNVSGLNRTASFKGQVNQRTDFSAFDEKRQVRAQKKLEYLTRANYIWPYIFNYPLTFQMAAIGSRKRYYSFDADALQAQFTLSKIFSEKIYGDLSYQLEDIIQKDASDSKDNKHLRIGGITPSITLDLRDNHISPQKGAYFNLSNEWANPNLFSQRKKDLEINYYKLVLRNKFYFPVVTDFAVLAISLSMGRQQDLVDKSSAGRKGVPGIKLFRLNGVDLIRGFRDDEINRVGIEGRDIDEYQVGRAYFLSFKLEPRFVVSENLILAVFYDAGRVYVDHIDPDSMRNSIGVGFKYLTPIGSLDFDYGIKLWRKQMPSGAIETPGAFNISIGFF
ncbi:MAG: BamA/TamA family outer membrane protein [Oligoflexia bacterium]|nr:BamA/TamA family outer membrane protein [Oligoflexia bacterium]